MTWKPRVVGHHPDALNASPASATGVSLEELSQILRDEWTLVSCEQTAQFLLDHPRLGPLLAQSTPFPAPVPAGEVAELVAWLRDHAYVLNPSAERKARRICDLLEQQATAYAICERERLHQSTRAEDLEIERHPMPVAVSERLPGPEDCDAEGRCWVGYPELTYSIADTGDTDTTTPEWRLEHQPLKPKGSRCWWLPATALPLPGNTESGGCND